MLAISLVKLDLSKDQMILIIAALLTCADVEDVHESDYRALAARLRILVHDETINWN